MAKRRFQPLRVLTGILLMLVFAFGTLAIMVRYAGGWGVPYFSFTTERGSRCTNTLTGYVCEAMTLADVEFFGGVDLPDDTRVVSAGYQSTHDYRLDALLDVPARSADAALYELNEAFGTCGDQQPQPLSISGLKENCVIVNPTTDPDTGEPTSRLFLIGTGVLADGKRAIYLAVRSR